MKLLASTIDFCTIAAMLGFLRSCKRARSGKADRNGLALVNGQPCRDRLA